MVYFGGDCWNQENSFCNTCYRSVKILHLWFCKLKQCSVSLMSTYLSNYLLNASGTKFTCLSCWEVLILPHTGGIFFFLNQSETEMMPFTACLFEFYLLKKKKFKIVLLGQQIDISCLTFPVCLMAEKSYDEENVPFTITCKGWWTTFCGWEGKWNQMFLLNWHLRFE